MTITMTDAVARICLAAGKRAAFLHAAEYRISDVPGFIADVQQETALAWFHVKATQGDRAERLQPTCPVSDEGRVSCSHDSCRIPDHVLAKWAARDAVRNVSRQRSAGMTPEGRERMAAEHAAAGLAAHAVTLDEYLQAPHAPLMRAVKRADHVGLDTMRDATLERRTWNLVAARAISAKTTPVLHAVLQAAAGTGAAVSGGRPVSGVAAATRALTGSTSGGARARVTEQGRQEWARVADALDALRCSED